MGRCGGCGGGSSGGGGTCDCWSVGDIKMGGYETADAGWLECNGNQVSRTTYAALFARIGTSYGAGNGTSTFNLPPIQDRFVVGAGSSFDRGLTGGEQDHALTVAELPSHSHPTVNSGNLTPGGSVAAGSGGVNLFPWVYSNAGTPESGVTGGGLPHNNLPPYIGVKFFIKT